MPTFRYTAKRGPQEVIEGRLEADSRTQALNQLIGQGYVPVRIQEASEAPAQAPDASAPAVFAASSSVRVPVRALNVFTRQFASLMRSQVPLLEALHLLSDQTAHPRLRRVIADMAQEIQQGQTLSGVLGRYPRVFSPLYVNLVRSGEISGMLDEILDRLAAQADRDEALRAKIQAALAYPVFVGLVGLGTVAFLMTFVMPRLLKLFTGFGNQLPLPTRMLMGVSHMMTQWWFWLIAAAVVGGVALCWRLPALRMRQLVERALLRLPLVGTLIQYLELSRFSRSFGLLLTQGVPILRAVEVALSVVRHHLIKQDLATLPERLREGGSLAASLKPLRTVNAFLTNTVAVGEKGGRAGEAFTEVANFYEREVERLLQMATALLEPTMVLLVGAVVGGIVMAVLLPIFELSTIVR